MFAVWPAPIIRKKVIVQCYHQLLPGMREILRAAGIQHHMSECRSKQPIARKNNDYGLASKNNKHTIMKNTKPENQKSKSQFNTNKRRPENKDNLDSREGEEQLFRKDDVTHNRKETKSQKKKNS